MMTVKLDQWRVVGLNGMPFLAAKYVYGHPVIPEGPIITSTIVSGEAAQGCVVVTKSGTNYELLAPLPPEEDCEFARGLMYERASRNFQKLKKAMTLEQLEEIDKRITEILNG